ncbi:XRE family transcriptional regulator [Conexibacter sp. JD483]|uniref:helix-turn-helix domain-containing protein n=1 Tax=unclassified Conexibacter TaxID=2627773 RepID=UPI002721B00F|nr:MULTISPECIES: XRE family transcriptional regulator [unclassified Conexibacter]MDO8188363.1 XRE family transcriptional regulator [Conexibacter sp. CPCC 205706]MDO8201109.1 XRE family transcriptional regulator [Conexibacter sp. CPCC 205762]MDR9372163.1 XRE family transcriptional regulator [Conexibacter sp. JD483]
MGRSPREDEPALDALQLGERLRAVREQAGIGVRELSRRVGMSASMISQLERGLTMPSVTTLYAITTALQVSLDALVAPDPAALAPEAEPALAAASVMETAPPTLAEFAAGGATLTPAREDAPGPVARRTAGRRIALEAGVRWELLAATPAPDVEFLRVTYEPGGASAPADALQRHEGREYGTVVEGRLGVTVGFTTYELEAGDSISFASTMPHRLFNLHDDRATTGFWVVVGRAGGADPAVYL